MAVALVASVVGRSNPQITVAFESGHGIKPGDALRYRGIEVGRVSAVVLNPAADRVEVEIELERKSAALARQGSQFWIERPRVSLSRVSGLETVVGANYLGVIPGPEGSPASRRFEGLETPPTLSELAPLEITIRFEDGHGLARGRRAEASRHRRRRSDRQCCSMKPWRAWSVKVGLVESGRRLARAGSQFWIERPQLSLTEVRGLETVVGGRYLAVQPGPADAEPLTVFDGLPRAPPLAERAEGGSGDHPGRTAAQRLASWLRRDVPRHRAGPHHIDRAVRRCRRRRGAGLHSARVPAAHPRQHALLGRQRLAPEHGTDGPADGHGVSLRAGRRRRGAGDTRSAGQARGHRAIASCLHSKPEEEWHEWRPRIALGSTLLPEGQTPPRPMRASLQWRERRFGLTRLAAVGCLGVAAWTTAA